MDKQKQRVFGKDIYLLGKDENGTYYWLEAASWDCDWYWGFGYVETYTNNKYPNLARDISSHQHFDNLFFGNNKNGYDNFLDFFTEKTVSNSELWTLCELMKTFYAAKEWAEIIHHGGANYTINPIRDKITNNEEYTRINNIILPAVFKEVYKILSPKE